MIYFDKLITKLDAILNKDVTDITAKHIYIPFLGNKYTQEELQAWLDEKSTLLSQIKISNLTDKQINTAITSVYNTLNAQDKLIADRIIVGEHFFFHGSDQAGHEGLVTIHLYKFVTTP